MFQRRPRKRVESVGQHLYDSEEIGRSIERDQALIVRTRRQREEIATDRDRFELTRDKIYLGVELISASVVLVSALSLCLVGHFFWGLTLLGGGGGGLGWLLRKRGGGS